MNRDDFPWDETVPHHTSTEQENKRMWERHLSKLHIMHYRNGREAKNGDKVVSLTIEGGKINGLGILYDAMPGIDYCNGGLAHLTNPVACMCDCLHVDDLAAILTEKGLDKRRVSK